MGAKEADIYGLWYRTMSDGRPPGDSPSFQSATATGCFTQYVTLAASPYQETRHGGNETFFFAYTSVVLLYCSLNSVQYSYNCTLSVKSVFSNNELAPFSFCCRIQEGPRCAVAYS